MDRLICTLKANRFCSPSHFSLPMTNLCHIIQHYAMLNAFHRCRLFTLSYCPTTQMENLQYKPRGVSNTIRLYILVLGLFFFMLSGLSVERQKWDEWRGGTGYKKLTSGPAGQTRMHYTWAASQRLTVTNVSSFIFFQGSRLSLYCRVSYK